MKLFLAGCAAELYVLIIRRFYVNGAAPQMVAWNGYLPVLGWIGVAILVLGGVLWRLRQGKQAALYLAGAGAFLAAASFLAYWNMSTVVLLSVLVPTAMLVGIFWGLYDRACALSLTVMGVALVAAWVCSRTAYQFSPYNAPAKTLVIVFLALMAAGSYLLQAGKLRRIVPGDPLPVYIACGISAVAMVPALINAAAAGYAMWGLALVMFGMVVYYTVKQL